ncbi:MAG TPA: hypothetical protein VGM26_02425 [Rhizomicrobium sp.]|jgi:hypothetical protein
MRKKFVLTAAFVGLALAGCAAEQKSASIDFSKNGFYQRQSQLTALTAPHDQGIIYPAGFNPTTP